MRRRRASAWLRQSSEGYCEPTTDAGSCKRGRKGSWAMPAVSTHQGWATAAAWCLDRCSHCRRCRFVSISLVFNDCSWYASCNTSRLHLVPSGFRSGAGTADVLALASAGVGTVAEHVRGTNLVDMFSGQDDELDRLQAIRPLPATSAWKFPEVDPVRPLLLLGLISGDIRRRTLLRCTWVGALPSAVRARFVVGLGQPDGSWPDVLLVRVNEQEGLKRPGATGGAPGASTWTQYAKVVFFCRWASEQPEPLIAKGDDDLFIAPRMLLAHVHLLVQMTSERPHLVAGVFDSFRGVRRHSTLWLGGATGPPHTGWRAASTTIAVLQVEATPSTGGTCARCCRLQTLMPPPCVSARLHFPVAR